MSQKKDSFAMLENVTKNLSKLSIIYFFLDIMPVKVCKHQNEKYDVQIP